MIYSLPLNHNTIQERFEAMLKENDKLKDELNEYKKKNEADKVQKENIIINDDEENTARKNHLFLVLIF